MEKKASCYNHLFINFSPTEDFVSNQKRKGFNAVFHGRIYRGKHLFVNFLTVGKSIIFKCCSDSP